MAEGIKIQIYRNETADVLTKKLADPGENAGIGSAAAAFPRRQPPGSHQDRLSHRSGCHQQHDLFI